MSRIISRALFLSAIVWAPTLRAVPADAPAEALEEITVTAEKTTQNLQKTAAAITAITGDSMIESGITDLRQAQQVVPAVRFQAEGNTTQVFIRGVGANLDFANVQPNVAFNFAGIYMPREATSAAFFDVAQLEILPGTQGTLYGRSAIGGTINLTPAKPGFDDEGRTIVELGNYALVHATITQDFKVSDTIALRAAIDYQHHSGYEVTGADSANNISGRISALIKPNDQLTIYLWGQGAGKNGWAENLVNKGSNPATGTYCEQCFYYGNAWNDTRTGRYAGPFGEPVKNKSSYNTEMFGGQIDYDLGFATLTYLPSYLYLNADPLYWLSAIQSSNSAHFNQLTQELRLASGGDGPWKWLSGLYWYNSRNYGSEYLENIPPAPFYQINVNDNQLKGFGLYGQVTYSVTDALRVTAGGRASSSKTTADGFEVQAYGGDPYSFNHTWNHVDWKLGAEYDITQRAMVYAVAQTGFQPGTYNALPNAAPVPAAGGNPAIPGFNNIVNPEELKSYTAGIKTRWLDDRLQINNEIYYYDFHNLIIQAYDISLPYNLIFNGDKIKIRGDQLDVLAKVFTNDTFNVNVGYSHARNTSVTDTSGVSYDGLQPAYAPDLTAMAGYTHNMPVGAANLRMHIDWRYESSWYADYVHNRGTKQVPSNKGDAALTYEQTQWSAGLWIKNMTNRAVIAATAAAGIPGPATAFLEDPRTFGAMFSIKY